MTLCHTHCDSNDEDPDFDDFIEFGNWSVPAMKQLRDLASACPGVSVDVGVSLELLTDQHCPPTHCLPPPLNPSHKSNLNHHVPFPCEPLGFRWTG